MNDPLQAALEDLAKGTTSPAPQASVMDSPDNSVSVMLVKVAGMFEIDPTKALMDEMPMLLKEAAACITDLKTKLASGVKQKVITDITSRLQGYGDLTDKDVAAKQAELEDYSMEKLSGMANGLDATGVPDMKMFTVSQGNGTPPTNTEEGALMRLGSSLGSLTNNDPMF